MRFFSWLAALFSPWPKITISSSSTKWEHKSTATINGRPATKEEEKLIDEALENMDKAMGHACASLDNAGDAMARASRTFDKLARIQKKPS
jgi:hypothetical protein